jgi:hypothetical protein
MRRFLRPTAARGRCVERPNKVDERTGTELLSEDTNEEGKKFGQILAIYPIAAIGKASRERVTAGAVAQADPQTAGLSSCQAR